MNKTTAFVMIIFIQFLISTIIFLSGGLTFGGIFITAMIVIDVVALLLDYIDERNRRLISEIHKMEMEMLKTLHSPNKSEYELIAEVMGRRDKEYYQFQSPKAIGVVPEDGDYTIVRK